MITWSIKPPQLHSYQRSGAYSMADRRKGIGGQAVSREPHVQRMHLPQAGVAAFGRALPAP